MKNLKKVLALGLALVMILGMFTIASAAETKKTAQEFTDWADVEHKDAVALAVDLGIISGKPDGSFAPNDPIDRASWAKLVYYTATGDDNADAYLGTATDLTDIKGNWAESYINYIYVNNYVSGDGQGHFMPTSNITVAGGLKTMLTVLGYDADDRGYQNDSAWMGNIMTDAKRNGLMDDVDRKNTAATNLTRDVAAQIIYNALQAQIVTPEYGRDNGESYVIRYNKVDGLTLARDVFSIAPVTVAVSVNNSGDVILTPAADAPANLSASDLEDVKASSTLAGESAVVWVAVKTNGAYDGKVISTTVAKAASSAAKTFTDIDGALTVIYTPKGENGYDEDHFVAEAKKTTGQNPVNDIEYYEDGASVNSEPTVRVGDVVEVYTADNKVTTIKVTTWDVFKLSDDLATRTSSDKLQVRLPGVTGTGITLAQWTDADTVTGYQGLVKGDVILVNKDASGDYTIEKAEKVTGSVSSKRGTTDAKLTINGKQYQESGIAVASPAANVPGFSAWNVANEKNNEYDFYLDKNGTVCFKVLVEGETTTEVAYVLQAKKLSSTSTWDSSFSLQAELLFTDGTTEIVTVSKVGGLKVVDKDNVDSQKEVDVDTLVGDQATAAIAGTFIDYSVDKDGKYEIEDKGESLNLSASAQSKLSIKNEVAFASGQTADSKTVFLVAKTVGDDTEYSVYTGFKNVPKLSASAAYGISKDDQNTTATYVYLETDSFEGDTPDAWIYIADEDAFDVDTDGLNVFEVYDSTGKKTTMAIATAISDPGYYKVTKTDEKNGNTVEKQTVGKELKAIGNGIVTIDTLTGATDEDTVVMVVDMSKDQPAKFVSVSAYTADTFSIDTAAYTYVAAQDGIKADGTGTASFIYVIRTEVAS